MLFLVVFSFSIIKSPASALLILIILNNTWKGTKWKKITRIGWLK